VAFTSQYVDYLECTVIAGATVSTIGATGVPLGGASELTA
jgi:hypothetical protein